MTKKIYLIPIFIILFTLTFFLYQSLIRRENKVIKTLIEVEVSKVADIINNDLSERIQSLKRIVKRWEVSEGTSKQEFISDANEYVKDDPGYQAIEWVDENFYVRWIAPYKGNEKAQGMNIAFEQNRRIALEKARDSRNTVISSAINLVQGGKGFLVYNPIYIDNISHGFVIAVFRTQEWLERLLEVQSKSFNKNNFSLRIYLHPDVIYSSDNWQTNLNTDWITSKSTDILNHNFVIKIKPTYQYIQDHHTYLPEVVLISGLLFSLLIVSVIFLLQRKSTFVAEITAAKLSLEYEVSIRKKTEQLLAKERQRLEYILEGTNVGTWEWNVQTGETIFNDHWASIIGYTLDEISPVSIDTWMKFAHPDDLVRSSELLEKNFNKELDFYECEARMKHKNGNWIWVLDRGKVATWTEDGKPLLMCGTHKDITQRKDNEEKIKHLATHDSLTGLPNIRIVNDHISLTTEMAKRKGSKVAILFIDLDGFKSVNDRYGHNIGDSLLKKTASRLLDSVRKVDTVARIGGDEFLIVLTDLESELIAANIAAKVIKEVSKPIIINQIKMNVGASVGISIFPEDGHKSDELIKKADKAMYEIKNSGKNNYIFYSDVT